MQPVWWVEVPARTALCAWNCLSPTMRVTSLKAARSKSRPSSSLSLQLGTFTGVMLDWPVTLTVSPTTLTYTHKHTHASFMFTRPFSIILTHSSVVINAYKRSLLFYKNHDFWRFYARQHSAYMPRQFRLSVHPSITRMLCIKTAEHIIEFFSLSDRPIILVFRHQGSLRKSSAGLRYCGALSTWQSRCPLGGGFWGGHRSPFPVWGSWGCAHRKFFNNQR